MEEIEAKFILDDATAFREKLVTLGAQQESEEFLMRRNIYEMPGVEGEWMRLRQEHDGATLTFKSQKEKSIDGMLETEVSVSNYEMTEKILSHTGLRLVTQQENYREIWIYKETEIVIDKWPWLAPYIEIEGGSIAAVRSVSEELGFSMNDAIYGTVFDVYTKFFDVTNREFHSITEIRFDLPMPDLLRSRAL